MNNPNQTIMENTIDYCHFFVVKRIPEQVSSFVFNLAVPTVIFTLTKNSYQFVMELLSTETEVNFDEVRRNITINPTEKLIGTCPNCGEEVRSVTELCEKCRQIVKEHQIQVVIIDDYYCLTIPNCEVEPAEKQDSACQQLHQLTNELDILTVAFAYTT